MITSIEIKNWKAFDNTKLDFLDGVNFLIGRNAVGKTSILEAICVAFTGEALTVDDARVLVRDNQPEPAEIIVDFLHGPKVCRIERIISKKQKTNSRLYINKQLEAEGWAEVTNYLSAMLGIDKNFFERAVYMSESDLLRFSSSLSKTSVIAQIEEALKIDKLTNLLNLVNNQKECYQKMDEMQKEELSVVAQIMPQQIDLYGLREKQIELQKLIPHFNAELEISRNDLYSKTRINEKIGQAINRAEQIKRDFADVIDSSAFDEDFLREIQRTIDLSTKQLSDINNFTEPKIKEKGSLEERLLSLNKILDLFFYVEKEINRTSECPVCRKPLHANEVKDLKDRFIAEKQALIINLSQISSELIQQEKLRQQTRNKLDMLNSAKTELQLFCKELQKERLAMPNLYGNKNRLFNEISDNQKAILLKTAEVEIKTKELYDTQRLIDLSERTKEFGNKESIDATLVSTNKALIALELLEVTANETIEKQRKTKLDPIIKEISDVWNKMKGTKDCKIEVDGSMVPFLIKNGQKQELSQLSGGEKTALLIIIRTVLCRRFLQTGFMLLDEPLEHLDPENRRIIVDFLVESYEKGWVDQLIITTFEESLVRKFLGRERVNVIAI